MSTSSSHAWLTPSPGRCHSFRTHQVSHHCKSSVSSSGAEGQSLHATYHTLSGIFCLASLHQLGVRAPNRHQKEGSGRETKPEWREACCLLRQGAAWVECTSDNGLWRVGSVRLMPQWRLWQLRERCFCVGLPVTLHIVVNALHSWHSASCLLLCSRLIKKFLLLSVLQFFLCGFTLW